MENYSNIQENFGAVRFDPDGTAHIQNLTVPIPATLSPEAAEYLKQRCSAPDPTNGFSAPLEQLRLFEAAQREQATATLLQEWPSKVEVREIGGVPIRLVTPERLAIGAENKLLINLHGGAFMLGQGSIAEAIPIAALTGIPVCAIDYRLAPETPFPGAVDDTLAVYRALLKNFEPYQLAIYGSSAGAMLSAQVVVKARQLGLPLPAAIGFFSGQVDASRLGDSEAFFSLQGLAPVVVPSVVQAQGYIGNADVRDPVMSPIYAELKGFPPTLCMTGTRDFFLSGTSNFHRALLGANVPAELVVFDGLPRVHWYEAGLPESREALKIQANFLRRHL